MTQQPDETAEQQADDQDAGPASRPTGAAAAGGEEVDQDAEPASEPDL